MGYLWVRFLRSWTKQHTNHCHLGVAQAGPVVAVVSVIDNLVKGAAGQALQNMNLALGLEESAGLS